MKRRAVSEYCVGQVGAGHPSLRAAGEPSAQLGRRNACCRPQVRASLLREQGNHLYRSGMASESEPSPEYLSVSVRCSTVTPNPSIERTANGGRLLLAPARPAAPLSAPHVKR